MIIHVMKSYTDGDGTSEGNVSKNIVYKVIF
jgi:hypothetical protein